MHSPPGVVRVGLLLEAVAVTGLGLSISLTANGWVLAAWLFLYGVGVGMATARLTSVILADVPVSQSGQASGLQSTFRQLGSALGIAVLGTLLVSTLAAQATENLSTLPGLDSDARTTIVSVVKGSAGAAIPEIGSLPQGGPAAQTAVETAMVTAARVTTLSAAGIILLGLLATIALPAMRPEDEGKTEAAPVAAQP